MFRAHVLIVRKEKLYITVSGIITPIGGRPVHRLREDSLNLNFIIRLFQASTCFEHMCSSSGGQNCIIQSLVSSHPIGGRPVHRLREDSVNLNFIISLFQASTCFEHMCSSSGGKNCIIQSLVSSHL